MSYPARLVLLICLAIAAQFAESDEAPGVSEDRIAEVKEKYAANSRMAMGDQMTDWLVEQGLSVDEATRIVRKATDEHADCMIDVLVTEAARQDIPLEPILDAFANLEMTEDIESIGEQWDKDATEAAMAPCLAKIRSEAGFPMSD